MFRDVSFPDDLDLRWRGPEDEWSLLRPFRCLWDGGGITVPEGFVNDLASVPQMLQNIVPVVGPQNLPAVVHDYLYDRQGRLPDGRVFTRSQADDLFLAGLEAVGVGWLRRKAMYAAVRVGGGFAWESKK